MDNQTLVIVLRGLERILVDLGGALSVYLGYQLFLKMPSRERGEGKFQLPGGISIFVSRVGPGVFFSLFGAAVLALALIHGVSQDETRSAPAAGAAGQVASAAIPGLVEASHYAGASATAAAIDPLRADAERRAAALSIRNLNRISAALRSDLPGAQRVDIERAISAAKLGLLRSVWDQTHWGSFAEFRQWVDGGEADPPPPAIAAAVTIYRAGAPAPAP